MQRIAFLIVGLISFIFYSCSSAQKLQMELINMSRLIYVNSFNYGISEIKYDSIDTKQINPTRKVTYYFQNSKQVKYEVRDLDSNLCCLGLNINDSITIAYEGVKLTDKNILDYVVSLKMNNKRHGIYMEGNPRIMKCFYNDTLLWSYKENSFKHSGEPSYEKTKILEKLIQQLSASL
jgi:hypothetical protein